MQLAGLQALHAGVARSSKDRVSQSAQCLSHSCRANVFDLKELTMLIEERIYTIAAGKLPTYLALYTNGPLDLQTRILGNLLGYFTSEIGPLSTLVHLWGYASFEDRISRREALAAEPEWQNYLSAVTPMIVRMENRLLVPTAFSPIR